MAFDYKKEYKALYQPPREPQFVTVPAMTFAAVRGQGDPNDHTGEYKAAIELLYQVCYLVAFYNVVLDFEPNRAVLYTVLAFFGLGGVCLMLCRNNVPVGVAGKCGPTQPKYHVHP